MHLPMAAVPLRATRRRPRIADANKKEKALTGHSKRAQTSIDVGPCATGDEYTVSVVATNTIGISPSSKPSAAIQCGAAPAKAPAAPAHVAGAPAAGGKITVTFVEIPDDGGGVVNLYVAAASDLTPGNKERVLIGTTTDPKATSILLSGCKAGDSYRVAVVASRNGLNSAAAKGAKEVTCTQ